MTNFSAVAETGSAFCGGLREPTDELQIAKVTTSDRRVHFVLNDNASTPDCPSHAASCQQKAYVVAGDLLILGQNLRSFVCATYFNEKGFGYSGWLPKQAVSMIAPRVSVSRERWIGSWSAPEKTIVVRSGPTAGTLVFSGEATFGSLDADRVRRGAVNVGEFEVETTVQGDAFAFTAANGQALRFDPQSEGCGMQLRLQGEHLIVMDNRKCGGLHVTFSGIYRKDAQR